MANWHRVASSAEVGAETPLARRVDGVSLALYRLDGRVRAIGDLCPHQGDVFLSQGWLENGVIECPMHQACFDIRTGKRLSGPASKDVPCYPVKEEDGAVFVSLE